MLGGHPQTVCTDDAAKASPVGGRKARHLVQIRGLELLLVDAAAALVEDPPLVRLDGDAVGEVFGYIPVDVGLYRAVQAWGEGVVGDGDGRCAGKHADDGRQGGTYIHTHDILLLTR